MKPMPRFLTAICLFVICWIATPVGAVEDIVKEGCAFDVPDAGTHDSLEWLEGTDTMWVKHSCTELQDNDDDNNLFRARISKRVDPVSGDWTGSVTKPVVLFITSPPTHYISQGTSGVGWRALQDKLYDAGARILEIKFKCPAGINVHEMYKDSNECQFTLLLDALEQLMDRDVLVNGVAVGEKWWPIEHDERFAMGVSLGQNLIQYVNDALITEDTQSVGIMNRVVYGGGGALYDLYDQVNCNNDPQGGTDPIIDDCYYEDNNACPVMEGLEMLFASDVAVNMIDDCGGCWDDQENPTVNTCPLPVLAGNPNNCPNTNDCAIGNSIRDALDDASMKDKLAATAALADARVTGGVLFNTGFDRGTNERGNNAYFEKRLGSNEVMWNMNECVCSCAFNGHGLVGRMRGFFKTPDAIEDWAEYFIEGETTFDYFEQFKDGNGDPLFTLENPPELADCTDPNLFNVSGQIVCGLVEPPIPSEDLPNCTGGS